MTVKAVNLNGYKTQRTRARRSKRANYAANIIAAFRSLGMTDDEIKATLLKMQQAGAQTPPDAAGR